MLVAQLEWMAGSIPDRQRPGTQQRFGGPLAEIYGERDAVPIVSGQDQHVLTVPMAAKNGPHAFGEENRAGPAVRNANGFQRGMQTVHAAFEPAETLRGFSLANIEAVQIGRGELG